MARAYLRTFAQARAAVALAGFDRVVTYGGPVAIADWMTTREEIAPGSVAYYLEGDALREKATCPDCRAPFAGPWPDEAGYLAAPLPPCCRAWADRNRSFGFILGIWPLLRPGEAAPPSTIPTARPASLPAGAPWPAAETA